MAPVTPQRVLALAGVLGVYTLLYYSFSGSGRGRDRERVHQQSSPAPPDFDEAPFELPILKFVSADDTLETHRRLGEAMGTRFAQGIQARVANWPALQTKWLPFLTTEEGQLAYQEFLRIHKATYPEYVQEMEGMAEAAGVPFETLFIVALKQEWSGILYRAEKNNTHLLDDVGISKLSDHCSDYAMCSPQRCVGAHNEDGPDYDVNNTFVLDAQLGDTRFRAFVYMGSLPTSAFAVNSHGIGFSLNFVHSWHPHAPGIGRDFATRNLTGARTIEEAISSLTPPNFVGGMNVQIFDFNWRSIHNVEVNRDHHSLRAITSKPFFHSNQYQTLYVSGQHISHSSFSRLARATEMPAPESLDDMLMVLGDQGDVNYTVFRDSISHALGDKSDWTLATAVFDLDASTVTIMQGNPKLGNVRSVWDLAEIHPAVHT
jgi:hypothetical protein